MVVCFVVMYLGPRRVNCVLGIVDMTSLSGLHSQICSVSFGMCILGKTYHLFVVLGVLLVIDESISYGLFVGVLC